MESTVVSAPRICVVHLVRAVNGPAPFSRFLGSYAKHHAGIPHHLLVVFKGFEGPLPDEYERELRTVVHERHFVSDAGHDIDVYFNVARHFEWEVFCFLNSYSLILADSWLLSMSRALSQPGVGMVGASGSSQSISDFVPTPDTLVLRRPLWKRTLLRWFPFLRPARLRLIRWRLRRQFDPFPNYHLRTNAFMLTRETALSVRLAPTKRKFDAYLFESGRQGLTSQVMAMGKRVLVVGRNGKAYDMPNWHRSNTFWRSNQENLLVSDNQTRMFDDLDTNHRMLYSHLAWGPQTDAG